MVRSYSPSPLFFLTILLVFMKSIREGKEEHSWISSTFVGSVLYRSSPCLVFLMDNSLRHELLFLPQIYRKQASYSLKVTKQTVKQCPTSKTQGSRITQKQRSGNKDTKVNITHILGSLISQPHSKSLKLKLIYVNLTREYEY